jgi:hypothetical protein
MIKSLVIAAALTVSLTGYAFAQDTAPGAPAGTKPVTPPPITDMANTAGKPMHHPMHATKHHPTHHPKHHTPAAPMASPTDAPK